LCPITIGANWSLSCWLLPGLSVKITIISIEDDGEPQLLRLQFEHLGFSVQLRRLGRPSEFFTAFDFFGGPADAAIICGHGDEGGFIFPAMAPGVDSLVLPADRLTPAIVGEHLRAVPPTVLTTGCDTGRKEFAQAFLGAGARNYIAPFGYPDSAAAVVLLTLAAYRVASAGSSWDAAVRAANNYFTLENRWQVWR
jgi:hypothetical protein